MDIAGLAALLALPAGLITALSGIRERSLFARLERVEKVLKDGSVWGEERTMLRNARDHLAERIALGELQPKLWSLYVLGFTLLLGSIAYFAWIGFDPFWANSEDQQSLQRLGWLLYAAGGATLVTALIWKAIWQKKARPNQYRRASA